MKKFYVFIFAISIFLCAVISSTSSAEETAKFQKAVSNKSTVAPANQKLNPQRVWSWITVSHVDESNTRIFHSSLAQNLDQNFNYKKYKECCRVVVKFNAINTKQADYDFKIQESSGNKDIDEFTISTIKKTVTNESLDSYTRLNKGYITIYYNCPFDYSKYRPYYPHPHGHSY